MKREEKSKLTLGDLSQRPSLLPEVDDHSNSTSLSTSRSLLNSIDEVRSAGADVGTEDVGSVAFVVDSARTRNKRRGGRSARNCTVEGEGRRMMKLTGRYIPW